MREQLKKILLLNSLKDFLTVIIYRGISYFLITSLLSIKFIYLSSEDITTLGSYLTLTMLLILPLAGAFNQIAIRRIAHNGTIQRDIFLYMALWTLLTIGTLSIGSIYNYAYKLPDNKIIQFLLTCSFLMAHVTIGVQILWLQMINEKKILIITILIIIMIITLDFLNHKLLIIDFNKNTLELESALLLVPIIINLKFINKKTIKKEIDSYPLNFHSITKYIIIGLVYNGIIATNWYICQSILSQANYHSFGQKLLFFERFLMPAINIISSYVLIRTYRSQSLKNQKPKTKNQTYVKIYSFFFLITIIINISLLSSEYYINTIMVLGFGYIIFGFLSIFLDLLQETHRLSNLMIILLTIYIAFSLTSYFSINFYGIRGFSLSWFISNALIVVFVNLLIIPQKGH